MIQTSTVDFIPQSSFGNPHSKINKPIFFIILCSFFLQWLSFTKIQFSPGEMDYLSLLNCFSMYQIHRDSIRSFLTLHWHFWIITPLLSLSSTFYPFSALSPIKIILTLPYFFFFIEAFVLFLILKSCLYLKGHIADPCQIFVHWVSLSLTLTILSALFRHSLPRPHPGLISKCSYFIAEIIKATPLKLHSLLLISTCFFYYP